MPAATIGDNADMVGGPKLANEEAQRALDESEPVFPLHGAGGVDDEDESRVLAAMVGHIASLNADARDPCVVCEGRAGAVDLDAERASARLRVVLVEVVDEFFDSHGVGVGPVAVEHEAPGDCVRGRVNVHGEGGQVVGARVDEGVDAVVLEEGGVIGRGRGGNVAGVAVVAVRLRDGRGRDAALSGRGRGCACGCGWWRSSSRRHGFYRDRGGRLRGGCCCRSRRLCWCRVRRGRWSRRSGGRRGGCGNGSRYRRRLRRYTAISIRNGIGRRICLIVAGTACDYQCG